MASIIVPTDFSENAYNALFYATQLFPDENCTIYLVHSYEATLNDIISKMDPVANEAITAKLRSTVQSQLEQLSHRVQLDCAGYDLKVELMYAALPLNEIINDLIENLDVQLVVMGTKGASGLKEIFIGSQAVDTIKNISPIPLFLIPINSNYIHPKNIAYATDFKKNTLQNNIDFLKKIIKANNSKLQLVHFHNESDVQREVEPQFNILKEQLNDVEFTTHWVSSKQSVESDLNQFCKTQNINLLTLLFHKYSFLKSVLKTSTVEKISFHTDLPLLILPEEV
ncbi:putative universal stress protein UspA [Nonlabens ulvanivorans]|uniref:Putative universal stress protein UspA n=1 Tax=Nonlabens ulvanivorans TaxID=906888 RepID=A0A090WIE5_NONUL|nr:universal stress protein [Nonlabens ulvanivorans]GAL75968.1 putative universal stress protein UspA [Nonlabens ulvanivorans]